MHTANPSGSGALLVSSITDGMGNNVQFNYVPITLTGSSGVYTPGSSYSYPNLAPYDGPLYVVSSYTANSGANDAALTSPSATTYTDNFSYQGAATDLTGRGFLGFASVTVVDGRTGHKTTTDYQQQFPYIGMAADQVVYTSGGAQISSTYNTPARLRTLGSSSNASFPYVAESDVTTWGADSDDGMSGSKIKYVVTTTSVDSYGDPTLIQTETKPFPSSSSQFFNDVIYRYDVDVTNWCVNLPKSKTVAITSTASPDTTPGTLAATPDRQARQTTYVNDTANCRMTSETQDALEAGMSPTTSYSYDSYGNVSEVTVTDDNNNELRHTSYDFSGTNGVFPSLVTRHDPASGIDLVTSQQWDLTNDTLTSSSIYTTSDPGRALTTTYTFDPYGRKWSEQEPDGTSTAWEYHPSGMGCGDVFGQNVAAYYITQTHAAADGTPGATSRSCYDSFNRPVMAIRYLLGGQAVYQDTEYNLRGLKASVSQPHTSTSVSSVYWTNSHFDDLDRPSSIYRKVVNRSLQQDGGSKTTFSYNSPTYYVVSQTVQTYNTTDAPSSETKSHFYNMVGYTKEVDDALNSTHYSTDAFGDVIGITDQAGNNTTLSYDSWGHKTGMADPDMGSWSYAYDALGELTCQTDANTQSTVLGYDNLGRQVTRLVPASGTDYCIAGAPVPTGTPAQWVYDTAAYGPGQLASETDGGGFTKAFSYDQYGHAVATDTNVGGADYEISTGYDTFGRVASITYPTMPASANQAPLTDAGTSQLTVLGSGSVILDGSRTSDPDNGPVPLSYTWTQQSGPVNVGIDGSRTSTVTFTPTTVGIYTFQLTAGDGQGADSATTQVTVNPPVPGAPRTDTPISTNGSFTLKWDAVSGVASYWLFESTDNVNFTQIQTVQDNGTNTEQVPLVGLGNGTYYFAYCSYANGSCTTRGPSVTEVVTLPPGPASGTSVTPAAVTPNQSFTVRWTKPGLGVWTYYVVRGDNNPGFTSPTDHTITGSPLPPTSWTNSLGPVGTYYYKVLACNGDPANGSSGACSATFSNTDSVQVMNLPGAPGMHNPSPTSIVIDGSSTLSWTAPCCSVTSYTQDASFMSNFSTFTETNLGNVTSETVSPPATKYYRVKACNAIGCGAWSGTATLTVTVGGNNMMAQPADATSPAPDTVTNTAPAPATDSGGISMSEPTESMAFPVLSTETLQVSAAVVPVSARDAAAQGTDETTLQRLTALRSRISQSSPSLLDPVRQAKWQKRWHQLQHSLAEARQPALPEMSSTPSSPAEALERARTAAVFRTEAGDHRSLQYRLTKPAYGRTSIKYRVQDASSGTATLTVDYVYDDQENLEAAVNHADPTLVYWQAQAMDEYGHYTGELYGNNVLTTGVYDDATGAIEGVQTGLGGSTEGQSLVYTWDGYGNMVNRQDTNTGMIESFQYDGLNRVTQSAIVGSPATPAPMTLSYSSTGDIQSKSDVASAYTPYAGHAHRLQSLTTVDGGSVTYSYDNNGNLLSSSATGTTRFNSRSASWTAQNQPSGISDGGNCMSFAYDPDGARYSERTTSGTLSNGSCSGAGSTTLEIGGGFEVITPDGGSASYRVMIMAAGKAVAVMNVSNSGGPTATLQTSTGTSTSNYLNYLHYDSLGNVDTVTDASGNLIAAASGGKMSYDIFGQRRDAGTWAPLSAAAVDTLSTDMGYTNHKQLDSLGPLQGLGLVHMNGRVYDPTLGRFISADPRIPNVYNSQDLNRFAYVDNNPLNSSDPTGFDGTDDNGGSTPPSPTIGLPPPANPFSNISLLGPGSGTLSAGNSSLDNSNISLTPTNPSGNNFSLLSAGDPFGSLGLPNYGTGPNPFFNATSCPGGDCLGLANSFLANDNGRAGQLFCPANCYATGTDAHIAADDRYLGAALLANVEVNYLVYQLPDGSYSFTYGSVTGYQGLQGDHPPVIYDSSAGYSLWSGGPWGHIHWDSNYEFSPQDWRISTQENATRGAPGVNLFLGTGDGRLWVSPPDYARQFGRWEGAQYLPPLDNYPGIRIPDVYIKTTFP